MTPAKMDEACRLARVIDTDAPDDDGEALDCALCHGSMTYEHPPDTQPICDRCAQDAALTLARALLAAVDGMQAAVRDRDLARDGESESHQAGAAWRTERRLMRDEIKTAAARAVAAEQRAEALQARYSNVMWGPVLEADVKQAVADEERARVVEAIAAWCDGQAVTPIAAHIRNTNWAAPEGES
jgi:hypothetical protein